MDLDVLIDPLAAWVAMAGIAALFAHAALAKLADPALTEQHLAAYRLPYRALAPSARLLPAAEGLAAVLLLSPWRAAGAALAALLLLAYAAAMGWHLAHGHRLDCGCGGAPLPVSWALVVRNLVLAVIAAVGVLPVAERAMAPAEFAVVCAATVLASLLYAAFNQVLRHLDATPVRPSSWRA